MLRSGGRPDELEKERIVASGHLEAAQPAERLVSVTVHECMQVRVCKCVYTNVCKCVSGYEHSCICISRSSA